MCGHKIVLSVSYNNQLRESSFNMTRGGGMKILRWGGGLQKFLDILKGGFLKNCWARRRGSKNLYTSKPTRGGAPKKLNR